MDDAVGSVSVLTSLERTRLVLAGEIDMSVSGELAEAVDVAIDAAVPVDVDVRNVTFIDSSGLANLVRLGGRAPSRPRLIQPPEVVRFVLDVTNAEEVLEVVMDDPGFPGAPQQDGARSGPRAEVH